jgi:transposase
VRRAQGGDAVARAGSGFTLLFEAYVLALAKTMPIANAAERLGEHDTRLWRIVEHYVWRAVEKLDLSLVRRIAADETSARRAHDYISLFVDMARRKVVYVADGKDAATVKEFADFLEAHGGRREAVTDASIDMGAAFEVGIKENFPKRYIFLKNVDRLTQEEKEALSRLEAQNLDTIQAMQIRMNLQLLFTMSVKSARRFPRPLERRGSSLRPRADEEAGQDDHGQVGRHPQIDRHRPFQWRSGGDQRQCPGRQAQGQGLPNQTKPQSRRLPHRR